LVRDSLSTWEVTGTVEEAIGFLVVEM